VHCVAGDWHKTSWNGKVRFEVPKPKSNLPTEPLRWSLYRAAIECGTTEPTLQKRLQDVGEKPDPRTHTFSTLQIVTAMTMGGSKALRDRAVKARAENWELKNDELRKLYLPAKSVEDCLIKTFAVMKSELMASSLSENEKRSLLMHLADIDVTTL
jgi:hypothetical protein